MPLDLTACHPSYLSATSYQSHLRRLLWQPIEFSRKLTSIAGKVGQVRLVNSCVRVSCSSLKQKTVLLNLADWGGNAYHCHRTMGQGNPTSKSPALEATLQSRYFIWCQYGAHRIRDPVRDRGGYRLDSRSSRRQYGVRSPMTAHSVSLVQGDLDFLATNVIVEYSLLGMLTMCNTFKLFESFGSLVINADVTHCREVYLL